MVISMGTGWWSHHQLRPSLNKTESCFAFETWKTKQHVSRFSVQRAGVAGKHNRWQPQGIQTCCTAVDTNFPKRTVCCKKTRPKAQEKKNLMWVLVFIPSYFTWTYGHPSAGPSAKLPRPACLLPREQVQNSSFRELPRSRFFYDFSRSASAVTPGASAKAFCRGCMDMCCLYLLVSKALWDNVFGCTGWRVCLEHISK